MLIIVKVVLVVHAVQTATVSTDTHEYVLTHPYSLIRFEIFFRFFVEPLEFFGQIGTYVAVHFLHTLSDF